MLATFSLQYATYRRQTPMFLPKWGDWKRFLAPGKFRENNT
jgi:hypothetical protein